MAVQELRKVQQDTIGDPDGERLGRYLTAHLVLERAVHRRVVLAWLAAVLAVQLWFASRLPAPRSIFYLVLTAFAVGGGALLGAIANEIVCRQSIRQLSRGVQVETIELDDRRVAPRR